MLPKVPVDERETTVTYSVGDRRNGGNALITTFDAKLKAAALRAGGAITHSGKTDPPYWCLTVPATAIRIAFKRKVNKVLSEEHKAKLQAARRKAKEEKV